MTRRSQLALSLILGTLLSAAPASAQSKVPWTVVNDGSQQVRVTYSRPGFAGQRKLAPGQETTVNVEPEVYDVEFLVEGSSRVRRERIDLRRGPQVTFFPEQPGRPAPAPASPVIRLDPQRPRALPKKTPSRTGSIRPWCLVNLDVFGGVAHTSSGELKLISETTSSFLLSSETQDHTLGKLSVPSDTQPIFGLRGGVAWDVMGGRGSTGLLCGPALEWSHYSATGGPVEEFTVDTVSLLFFTGRLLLKADVEHPHGLFQISAGLGMGINVSDFTVQIPSGGGANVPTKVSESAVDVGFEFRLGAALPIYGPVALFVEYRLSYFNARTEIADGADRRVFLGSVDEDIDIEREMLTNQLVSGVSFQF